MENYKGYLIDDETSDQSVTVITPDSKSNYVTGNIGRARSFIDGLVYLKEQQPKVKNKHKKRFTVTLYSKKFKRKSVTGEVPALKLAGDYLRKNGYSKGDKMLVEFAEDKIILHKIN